MAARPAQVQKKGGLLMYYLKAVVAAGIAIATFTGAALAQGKPQEIKIEVA